jgi:hypothetical protein
MDAPTTPPPDPQPLETVERRSSALLGEGQPVQKRPAARRRFTLADAMIFVALFAVSLVPLGPLQRHLLAPTIEWRVNPLQVVAMLVVVFYSLSAPLVLGFTVATAIARLRPPGPGRVALAASVLVASLAGVVLLPGNFVLTTMIYGLQMGENYAYVVAVLMMLRSIVGAVLAVRLVLQATTRPRPAQDWVEALGRALSWFWISGGILVPAIS